MAPRAPKTRANGTLTEGAFWGRLRSHLRRLFLRWPPRAEALKRARQPHAGTNRRQKWDYLCAACGALYKGSDVQVDHIDPCGSLTAYSDLPGFVERLLCESEGLQVLCKPCHKEATAKERSAGKKVATLLASMKDAGPED